MNTTMKSPDDAYPTFDQLSKEEQTRKTVLETQKPKDKTRDFGSWAQNDITDKLTEQESKSEMAQDHAIIDSLTSEIQDVIKAKKNPYRESKTSSIPLESKPRRGIPKDHAGENAPTENTLKLNIDIVLESSPMASPDQSKSPSPPLMASKLHLSDS